MLRWAKDKETLAGAEDFSLKRLENETFVYHESNKALKGENTP